VQGFLRVVAIRQLEARDFIGTVPLEGNDLIIAIELTEFPATAVFIQTSGSFIVPQVDLT
jgi:hypothetical protein